MLPDQDPTGRYNIPGSDNGVQDAFWAAFLGKIKPYLNQDLYGQIEGNYTALNPLLNVARARWGDQKILDYLGYNPLKGAYTSLSYLTGNPYYDRTGSGAGDADTGRLFGLDLFRQVNPQWNYNQPVENDLNYGKYKHQYWWT